MRRLVYLVDDDLEVRRSLAYELAGEGVDAWPFADGASFLSELSRLRPACVFIGMGMERPGGLDIMAELDRLGLRWPVIALSGGNDLAGAIEAMKRGAVDFLEMPLDPAELASALERSFEILEERVRLDEGRRLAEGLMGSLTARERDVSAALLSGSPNKMVAYRLGISVRTVEKHRANIMAKLGVRSLAEAVVIASEAGLKLPQPAGRA